MEQRRVALDFLHSRSFDSEGEDLSPMRVELRDRVGPERRKERASGPGGLSPSAADHRQLVGERRGKRAEGARGYVELTLSFPLLHHVFLEALLGKLAFSLLYPLLLRPIELL